MAQRQFRSDDTSPKWSPQYGSGKDGNKSPVNGESYDGANAGGGGNAVAGLKNISLDTPSTFQNGDCVLIHQSRGTNAGVWELNKIASGGGTSSLVLKYPLCNNYYEDSNSQFQILELKEYRNVNIDSGINWYPQYWDGNKGGIIAFLVSGVYTNAGQLNVYARGFRGGDGASAGSRQGRQGEGYSGIPQPSSGPNGNGGGGGIPDTAAGDGGGGGGGASHASAGTQGTSKNNGGPGTPASITTADNASFTLMIFGGGGGEGGADDSGSHGRGGNGSGLGIVIARKIVQTGSSYGRGEDGTTPTGQDGGHGAGAGGGFLYKTERGEFSGSHTLSGGTGSHESSFGGNGGYGRVHIDYAVSYSNIGSSDVAIDSRQDKTLQKQGGVGLLMQLNKQ